MVARKGFYSHTIRSWSFSEPVPLDCKLHRYFSGFFSSPNGTKLLEPGGVEYYTLPGQLGSDITQQVRYCLTSFSCRKLLLKRRDYFIVFQNGSFSLFSAKIFKAFFSSICNENTVELWRHISWCHGGLWSVNSQNCPHWASSNFSIPIWVLLVPMVASIPKSLLR